MNLTNNHKKQISVLLFGLSIIFTIIGLHSIILADVLGNQTQINPDLLTEYYTPKTEHKQTLYYMQKGISNQGEVESSIRQLDFTYETTDMPMVDNDITFDFKATLRVPESVNRVYVITDHPNYENRVVPTKDFEQFVGYLKSLGGIYELQESNFLTYEDKITTRFGFKNDLAFWILVNNTNHGLEFIPIADRNSIIHISSFAEKLQIDTNRITLLAIEQSQINAQLQQKSNNITEGLSWIFLAIIFAQPAIGFWFSTFSNTRSK